MKDKTIRLLLIEDDKVDQMAFERFVKKEDLSYDYVIAGTVAEAGEVLQKNIFDVIVSDYWLGDGTSFELFDLFKDAPVVVTTGTGNEEVAVEAMKLGASDYIIKDPEGHYLKTLPATVKLALQRKVDEQKLRDYHERLESMVDERTAELQESEKRFRDITHSMADRVWEVDKEAKYTFLSNSGENILGYPAEELIGKTPFDLMPEEEAEKVREQLAELAVQGKAIVDLENWNLTKDGTKVCLLTNGVPILGANGDLLGYRGVDKDITRQRQLEKELLQSQKVEAVGTLAGGIAHDFNNILSAILGYSELIQNEVPADSKIGKDIKEVIGAGKRAVDLVKQILTLSRKVDTEKQPVQPYLVVKEALRMLRATLPTTVTIEENIDRGCGVILANSTTIHQIIVNLCTNALHAMNDQKGTLAVSLKQREVHAAEIAGEAGLTPGPFVVLTVRDTGYGMDSATLERIFEPYFTTKEVGKGTGLGLAVIQGIVQDMQGSIRVKSIPGQGSTFVIYFPLLMEAESYVPASQQQVSAQGGNEHILVVDDELLLVRVTQRQLENMGYKVTATSSSSDALEKVRANPDGFNLLITDQTMPGLTGVELTSAVQKIRPDMPVILCTGHSDLVTKERALEIGIKEYIYKPITGDELFQAVRAVLDGDI